MRVNMVACLLVLLFIFINILKFSPAAAQPGFISISCCAKSNTTDPQTNIAYTSDDYYLLDKVGECTNVSFPLITTYFGEYAQVFGNDNRTRWCYHLPVVQGHEYIVRATLPYGPLFRSMNGTFFKFSIGSTSVSTIDSSDNWTVVEGVFTATATPTNICLLKGIGNAYISKLELRLINDGTYLHGNISSILKLISRVDLGNDDHSYRYPDDPADRIWEKEENNIGSRTVRSSSIAPQGANSSIPIKAIQTAVESTEKLEFLHADLDTSHDDYLVKLYFLELDASVLIGQRVFDVYINGDKLYDKLDILQNGRASNYLEISLRVKSNGNLNISLVKASEEVKYGPICNAYEIFQVRQRVAETLARDANAMLILRNELMVDNSRNKILEKWYEDPCASSPWERVSCEEMDSFLVITKLDLSSMNLQGSLPMVISNLKELKELDVQSNNFTGSIPDSFTSLLHLSKLSIRCNPNLNSQLPPGLSVLKNLTVDFGSCSDMLRAQGMSSQRNVYVIGTVAGGSLACCVILGVFFICFYKRARPVKEEYPITKAILFSESSIQDPHGSYLNPVVQAFPLKYIERATRNYSNMIGEGGFGAVFRGTLPNGEEVAVKVRSATSTQGTREFDNEVTLLSTIRHENLVPLLGYCCEHDHQILVYPFMSNGSLQDRLYGEASKRKVLDWPTRLSIALGAARGLMYLHSSVGRCIIHRDVKSSNILLDNSMCGKVADFGFSKYAPQEGDTAASLEVRGTAGYLDPEYYSTQQLSAKSDVFSFGVVLLEIVTGREPLNIHRPRNEWSLVEWAKPFIRESRIDEIVDPSIRGGYHAEAMWRVVEAASACVENLSTYRPNMIDIVRELEDALIIENNASEYMRSIESFGGSNRFASLEKKTVPASTPSLTEPSASYSQSIAAVAPLPR